MPTPKRFNRIIALAVLALIGTGFWSIITGNALRERNATLFSALHNAGFTDTTYSRFLLAIGKEAAQDMNFPPTRVVSTGAFNPSAINIVVVEHPEKAVVQLSGVLSENDLALLRATRRNAGARPPNLILIDKELISELVLDIHNDLVGLANLFSLLDRGVSDDYERARTLGVIAGYIELANFRDSRTASRSIADSLGPLIPRPWEQSSLGDVFYLGFLPILAHEMGHLQSDSDGSFWSLPAVTRSRLSRLQFAREERADSLAFQAITRAIARLRVKSQGQTDIVVAAKVQSLGTLVKYLTDVISFEAFDGFRGLHTEHLIADVDYYNCTEQPAGLDAPSLGSNVVRSATPRALPLLLPSEYDSLRARIYIDATRRTHADHLIRAERLAAAALDSLGIDFTGRPEQLMGLFQSFDGDPVWVATDTLTPMSISRSTALNSLGGSIHFSRAVGCASAECETAVLPENGGYIELVHRSGQLLSFRAVLRFDTLASEADLERRAIFVRLVLNLLAIPPSQVASLAGGILRDLHQCGVVTATAVVNSYKVVFRTVEPTKWLSITLEPI